MNKKRLFLASWVILAILFVFDLIMLFYIMAVAEKPSRPTGGVVMLDPNATDERDDEGQGSSPGVTVAGFSSLTIPPDLDTVPIHLYNPIENSGLYYMTFELRLPNDSELGYEVLFTTGYVAPGKHIYQVTLSRPLPAGEYTAQLLIQPYRMTDLTTTNNVMAVVALTVK